MQCAETSSAAAASGFLRHVKTSKHEQQRGHVGLKVDRMLRLCACVLGVTAALTNFGQARVRSCAVGVAAIANWNCCSAWGILGEVIAAKCGVLGRALGGG